MCATLYESHYKNAMNIREYLAWTIVVCTYMFMFYGFILGFKLYPFYGTALPCRATEINYPFPVPTP